MRWSVVVQLLGFLLVTAGMWIVWSPWALVIAGGLLITVPEISELRQAVARDDPPAAVRGP